MRYYRSDYDGHREYMKSTEKAKKFARRVARLGTYHVKLGTYGSVIVLSVQTWKCKPGETPIIQF